MVTPPRVPNPAWAAWALKVIAACADANDLGAGQLAPVPQAHGYSGPPGPFAGPNSRIDYADGKNNGTDLVLFCQTQID
jgi:hypothetical protein